MCKTNVVRRPNKVDEIDKFKKYIADKSAQEIKKDGTS